MAKPISGTRPKFNSWHKHMRKDGKRMFWKLARRQTRALVDGDGQPLTAGQLVVGATYSIDLETGETWKVERCHVGNRGE